MAKKKVNKVVKKTLSEEQKLMAQLKELEAHSLYDNDGIIICSDGTHVNYKGFASKIKHRMQDLDAEEQTSVLATAAEYQSIKGKITMLRRKIGGTALFQKNEDWLKAQERHQEILDLFGKMFSAAEVHKIITTEWNLRRVKYDTLLKFQREHKDTISDLKDKYQKDVDSVRLVHKRSRLDELSALYSSRKMKYEESKSKADYELMLKTLEQIRKEVEGQQIHINGQIKVEHELAVQEHVNHEIMKSLNINDIIIGRLCARLNVNTKYIMYRLHTSYYSKFTGFLPKEMNEDEEINYPSQIVYDFNRIEALNSELDIKDIDYKEEPILVNSSNVLSLRDKLKAKLQEKRDKVNSQKSNINRIEGK